jgi:hypothetical protein
MLLSTSKETARRTVSQGSDFTPMPKTHGPGTRHGSLWQGIAVLIHVLGPPFASRRRRHEEKHQGRPQ